MTGRGTTVSWLVCLALLPAIGYGLLSATVHRSRRGSLGAHVV